MLSACLPEKFRQFPISLVSQAVFMLAVHVIQLIQSLALRTDLTAVEVRLRECW